MDNIIRRNLPHAVVKPVPIINKLLPADFDSLAYKGNIEDVPDVEIPNDGLVIVMGAVTLSKIAAERGWIPGSFINDDFTFEKWKEHYGENLLNHDSVVCPIKDVERIGQSFFIRPTEDSKSFSGHVSTWNKFVKWREEVSLLDNEFASVTPDTMVTYCGVKEIYREYRCFVVDKKIVTASLYKMGSKVIADSTVDQDILDYAQSMVDIWQPARAFVIDIALTLEGKKVIEINNFNSAGYYACDIGKIIDAIEGMEF